MKTFRQPWKNEKERSEVLDEKHRRGNAARAVRDKRREKTAMYKNESSAFKGSRHCKRFGEGSKQNAGQSRGSALHNSPNQGRGSRSPFQSYNYQSETFIPTELHNFHYHGSFASDAALPYPCPPRYSSTRQTSRWRDISHESYNEPSYSQSMNVNNPLQSFFPTESLNLNCHGGSASVAGLPYSSWRHTSRGRHGSYSEPSCSHPTYENDAVSSNYPRSTGSRHSLRYTTERYEWR